MEDAKDTEVTEDMEVTEETEYTEDMEDAKDTEVIEDTVKQSCLEQEKTPSGTRQWARRHPGGDTQGTGTDRGQQEACRCGHTSLVRTLFCSFPRGTQGHS